MLGPHGSLIGRCELRDATRTFRFDRVRTCVDLSTGEVVSNIADYFAKLHAQMPQRAAEKLRAEESNTLKSLYYPGKADGQFNADERAIVKATVQQLVADSRLNDKIIERVLTELGLSSLQGFKRSGADGKAVH